MDNKLQHGHTNHSTKEQDDCMFCIDVNLEYYHNLKEYGGLTKFLESLGTKKKKTS